MRLVATARATGLRVARDVHDGRPSAIPLLRAGAVVSDRYRQALTRAGIHAIYVDDEIGDGIEVPEALSAETRAAAEAALLTAYREVPDAIAAARPISAAAVAEIESVARSIAAEVAAAGDAAIALTDLAAADAYTLQHSIDVTVTGLLIARRLLHESGRTDGRGEDSTLSLEDALVRLGVGLLLHDVGKLVVPREILNKPGPLDAGEWEIVRRHPLAGLDLLPSDRISYHAKAVVRSHHERWDGGGYPDGRAGDEIPQFARIASVADVYDAVTSDRPYKRAAPPGVGWAVVVEGAGVAFDPAVVSVFRRVVAPFPPGVEVELADGRRGVVTEVPPTRLERPVVRVYADAGGRPVDLEEVALAEHPELELVPSAA